MLESRELPSLDNDRSKSPGQPGRQVYMHKRHSLKLPASCAVCVLYSTVVASVPYALPFLLQRRAQFPFIPPGKIGGGQAEYQIEYHRKQGEKQSLATKFMAR